VKKKKHKQRKEMSARKEMTSASHRKITSVKSKHEEIQGGNNIGREAIFKDHCDGH